MYGEDDLEAAVAAGAITAESAAALRSFVASQRETPVVDEENIRLVTSFNDIFVSIALLLILYSASALTSGLVSGYVIAALCWGLAEYFTRRRRMALPSILLTLGVVGGVATSSVALAHSVGFGDMPGLLVGGICGSVAAFLHWRRFRVPVVIAAGTVTALTILFPFAFEGLQALFGSSVSSESLTLWLIFVGGALTFAHAMRWDMKDRLRQTKSSDVAFWLHLASAPMIVHPAFYAIGGLGQESGSTVWVAVGFYGVLAVLALIVDRRAMLVPALGYVLYQVAKALETGSVVGDQFTVTALIVGSALLMLSVIWHPARRGLVGCLPARLQARLPA